MRNNVGKGHGKSNRLITLRIYFTAVVCIHEAFVVLLEFFHDIAIMVCVRTPTAVWLVSSGAHDIAKGDIFKPSEYRARKPG